MEQIEQQRFQRAFANAAHVQKARIDTHARARVQVGRELALEHILHFVRRAGKDGHGLLPAFHDRAGRGAAQIGHHNRAPGHHGLLIIVGRDLAAQPVHALGERFQAGRVHFHGQAEEFRHHFLGEVVLRGAKAAGGDHDIRARDRLAQRFLHAGGVIAHGGVPVKVHAQFRQAAGNILRVGIGDLAHEQLGADG